MTRRETTKVEDACERRGDCHLIRVSRSDLRVSVASSLLGSQPKGGRPTTREKLVDGVGDAGWYPGHRVVGRESFAVRTHGITQ